MRLIEDGVEWRYIPGYPYLVSNLGHIARDKTGTILKPWKTKEGYYTVKLFLNNKAKTVYVHRAVAEAFIENPKNKPQVNHIDGDRGNNCVENLEWVTGFENQKHRFYDLLHKSTPEQIAAMNEAHRVCVVCIETGNVYPSLKDAEKDTGVDSKYISACIRGKLKSAGGYHWVRQRRETNNAN